MRKLFIVSIVGTLIFSSGCSSAPEPVCVDAAMSLIKPSISTDIKKAHCENIALMFGAMTAGAKCDGGKTFKYLGNNTRKVIDHSIFSNYSEDFKKEMVSQLKEPAKIIARACY